MPLSIVRDSVWIIDTGGDMYYRIDCRLTKGGETSIVHGIAQYARYETAMGELAESAAMWERVSVGAVVDFLPSRDLTVRWPDMELFWYITSEC